MEGLLNKCGGRVAVAVVVMNVIYLLRTVALTLRASVWEILNSAPRYLNDVHKESWTRGTLLRVLNAGICHIGRMQEFLFVTNIEDF